MTLALGGALSGATVSAADWPLAEETHELIADIGTENPENAGKDEITETAEPAPVKLTLQPEVIHACGEINGFSVTNTKEALDASLAKGARTIEVDIQLTSDGFPVLLHDWNRHFLQGYDFADFPLSLEDFLACSIYGELTPLAFGNLLPYLDEYPDLLFVTDAKDCQSMFLTALALRMPGITDRFAIQLYDPEEYERYSALGFDKIILTLYDLPNEFKTNASRVLEAIGGRDFLALTFPEELADNEEYLEGLLSAGIPLYVHTVNDPERAETLRLRGIAGIYTDSLFGEEAGKK